jgi:rSAM/selenodomain-associated transferase 2
MPPPAPEQRLSVVIPTLDAGVALSRTLAALENFPGLEIVIADCGSQDATRSIAARHGAAIVDSAPGRGTQLAAGARAASGGWLLFLHADTLLLPGWQAVVQRFIADPAALGQAGYFRFALDDEAAAARRLERLVAWRCRRLALPYGDQGLLISRALYDSLGGFRPLPLMEDVELARRIGRRRLVALDHPAVTSAARYRRGYLRRSARNLLCLALYFAGLSPARIARLYR